MPPTEARTYPATEDRARPGDRADHDRHRSRPSGARRSAVPSPSLSLVRSARFNKSLASSSRSRPLSVSSPPARRAFQQPGVELRLQFPGAAAQRWLRHGQSGGGPADVQFLGDGDSDEAPELPKAHDRRRRCRCGRRGTETVLDLGVFGAVLGGLHLRFGPAADRTIDELAAEGPEVVVPAHCTSWATQQALAARLPDAFLPNSVGSTFLPGQKE